MKVSKLGAIAAIFAAVPITAPFALAATTTTRTCTPSIGAMPDNLAVGVVDMYGYAPDADGHLVVAGTRSVKATTWSIKTPSGVMDDATITYMGWIHAAENVSVSVRAHDASTVIVRVDGCTIPVTGKASKTVFANGWHNVRVTVVPDAGHQATVDLDVPGGGAFVAYGTSMVPTATAGKRRGQDHSQPHHHRRRRF